MRSKNKYPFIPKSTAYLSPGQFWSITLQNGLFACGRVLQLKISNGKQDSRAFLAGLLSWSDNEPPTFDSIEGAALLNHGSAHIKTISENKGAILGMRPLEIDGIEVPLSLDQAPCPKCMLRRGYEILRPATQEEQEKLEVFLTWGYKVIHIHAEKVFGGAI